MVRLKTMMNVLVIAQYFPPDMGGGATRAYNVAKGLSSNGCRVTVIAAFPHYPTGDIPRDYRWKPFKREFLEDFEVIRTLIPPLESRGFTRRVILFLSFMVSSLFALPLVGDIDVIFASNPNVLSLFPALVYGIFKRSPVVLNVDDLWPEVLYELHMIERNSLILRFASLIAKFAYKNAKLITPISPGYVNVICGKYGISDKKIHVVKAGVDLNKFKSFNYHDCGKGSFKVLYSGAFGMAYDFNQILLVAKKLEKVNGIEFILQGGGELARYLKARVKRLGLKNIKIIDRIVSRDEVARLLSEADALILPLRDFGTPYLGLSSKLYEYQAVGKPVICCAEGQPAEYIKETESGIVVRPGDCEALAKAVLYLRENRNIAEKLGASGRQYIENNLSIEKIGLRMREVLELAQVVRRAL
ncbi:glycosyltransferase family 4 protein [Candidatus Bathyarchaeota archaeon]|nr:glycosyltransferase family 4 protein [Candidatus Bathyarchaeota archaeon]